MDTSAGGRIMADTTTVFILYSYAVFLSTGDASFVDAVYPYASKAAIWMINRTTTGYNTSDGQHVAFPAHLQNTYDYLGLDAYPVQAYTAFLHMAAMRAIRQLAVIEGDSSSLPADAATSEALVAQTMQEVLWVNTSSSSGGGADSGFWRAWQTVAGDAPSVPMSGSLHGQNWASWLGLGWLAPQAQLQSHIDAEVGYNCNYTSPARPLASMTAGVGAGVADATCSVGLLTLPGAPAQAGWALDASPAQSMDNSAADVWLNGLPAILPSKGSNTAVPARSVIELYRSTLGDVWNVHDLHVGPGGLACGGAQLSGEVLAGTPFVNAHYARHLQGWSIQRAVTGQGWDAHGRLLKLAPPSFEYGYRLPIFTSEFVGVLVAPNATSAVAASADWQPSLPLVLGRAIATTAKRTTSGAGDGQTVTHPPSSSCVPMDVDEVAALLPEQPVVLHVIAGSLTALTLDLRIPIEVDAHQRQRDAVSFKSLQASVTISSDVEFRAGDELWIGFPAPSSSSVVRRDREASGVAPAQAMTTWRLCR